MKRTAQVDFDVVSAKEKQPFYLSLNITPISLQPNTPRPNRAEAAVRLLKAQLKIMLSFIKAGTAPASLEEVTHRRLVKGAQLPGTRPSPTRA